MATSLDELLGNFDEIEEFDAFKLLSMCVEILRASDNGDAGEALGQLELASSALTQATLDSLITEWNADAKLEGEMANVHADYMMILAELQLSFLSEGVPEGLVEVLSERIDASSLLKLLALFMSLMDASADFETYLIARLKK